MKTRLVVLVCLLNITLLGVGFFWFRLYFDRPLAPAQTPPVEPATWRAQAFGNRPPASPAPATTLPLTIYKTNQFTWSQLESSDYRQYITNLRAVGCPEATVRDIIITDVMRLYAARRGQFYQNGRAFKYWETDEKRKLKQSQLEERETQLALIDKELPAVLRELLGIKYERELNKYFVDAAEDDHRLAFLAEDKRSQALALRDEFEGRRERVMWQAPDGKITPGMGEELRRIAEEQRAALGGMMTAAELDEFDLTTSPTANRMRRELIGFNPTEAEFREIYQRERTLDAAYAYQDLNDPNVRAAHAADEQKMELELKGALGPQRASQLDQARNPDFQTIVELAARFDLPPETSSVLLDMRRSAEEARQQLLANQSLTPEQRDAALQAVQTETEKAARQTLGEKAYAEYAPQSAWLRAPGAN